MNVLGIDPGTAALGYGIVERTGGRLREVDHGCLDDERRPVAARAAAGHPRARRRADRAPPAGPRSASSGCSSRATSRRRSRSARPAGSCCWPPPSTGRRSARRPRTRSRARSRATAPPTRSRSQRMVQLVLGMSELPRPDDAADALAIATWVANTDRGGGSQRRPAVLDRAAVAPITRGETGYERAVREALAAERAATRAAKRTRLLGPRRTVIASVEGIGRRGRGRFARHRGRRASATGSSRRRRSSPRPQPGSRLKLHTYHLVREDQQALYGFRTRRGARVLHPAADRHRRRAEGRPRDRRVAPDAGPPARDHGPGPGRPGRRSRGSARSSPSGSSSSSRRR